MSITVDLSDEQVEVIVRAIKTIRTRDIWLETEAESKELENVMWALGRGDEHV